MPDLYQVLEESFHYRITCWVINLCIAQKKMHNTVQRTSNFVER